MTDHPDSFPPPALERASTPASSPAGGSAKSDLYLRMSAGAGVVGLDMHPERGYENYSADGASLSLELLVGASIYHGAALGGAVFYDLAPSMDLASSSGQDSTRSTVGIGLVGPFVDAFPERNWGLHLGLSAGFASLSVHPAGATRHPLYGIGGAAWAGYQFSIGEHWTMGSLLRVVQTVTGDESTEFDFEASCLATSLMLTAVHQ